MTDEPNETPPKKRGRRARAGTAASSTAKASTVEASTAKADTGAAAAASASQATAAARDSATAGRAARRAVQPAPPRADDETGPMSIVPMPMGTDVLDRMVRANMGRLTANLSPASLGQAFADWGFHLALAPGKQIELGVKALRKTARLGMYAAQAAQDPDTPPCIDPLPHDHRFDDARWQAWPFNMVYQSFLLTQQWWWNATTGVRGVSPQHEQRVQFAVRQMLDTVAPSNFPALNPVILETTLGQAGMNVAKGAGHLVTDTQRRLSGAPPEGTEAFRPGHEVAATPGKVVYRNRLVELIQYAPSTDTVHPEPVLIVPAWIMKYYILDLSPHNSLIRYLRDQGHTVFCLSWRNPSAQDRDLGMEDYRRNGITYVTEVIRQIVPDQRIHAVGYCLGGTLLAIEAARTARDGEDAFASLSFLATQVDFTEPGELELFIDEAEVSYLEDVMWAQGYLDTKQMAGAFQMLRSNDLIWSRIIQEYWLGERQPMIDLMAWNADATRMPYRMHAEYLRRLFLNNDLANGRYNVQSRPVALNDIDLPVFAVGTERDHIAPWRSVYKLHLFIGSPITFVLTSGGHNAGIVSEPGHPRRSYRVHTTEPADPYRDPDTWLSMAAKQSGSWWPEWHAWLAARSGPTAVPPPMGRGDAGLPPLADAPGTYVHQT